MLTEKSENTEVQGISNEDLLQELKILRKETKDTINSRKSLKITIIGFVVGILSLIVGITALGYIAELRNIEEIHVAMTPFHVQDKGELKNKYESYLRPVNERLRRKSNTFLSFKRYVLNIVISESYDKVFGELSERGNIQMAFVSHAIFNCNLDSIDCTGFEIIQTMQENKPVKPSVKLIGFKKVAKQDQYYSCLIWNKKRSKKEDDVPNINDSINILLGPDLSVSTHLVPEIYFLRNGRDIRKHDIGDVTVTSRIKMVDEIIEDNKIIIGALSNEDYDRLSPEQREKLYTYKIDDIPIPYDAILVNSDWWRKLGKKGQKIIKNSFKNSKEEYQYSLEMIEETDTDFQKRCIIFRSTLEELENYCSSTK
jgi:hypothetical protein